MAYTTIIDAAALAPLLQDPGIAVIDCRFDLAQPASGREAYLAGHIPGARYMSLDEDLSAAVAPGTGRHPLPQPDRFAARLGEFGVANDTQVIAYDGGNGAFAARLWWMLRWLGAERAAVLDGGYAAWRAAGGAVQCGPASITPAVFTPRVDHDAWVSTSEVCRAIGDPGRILVDARAPERFAGLIEPIDKVAGHVPGARNHPFTLNLRADGSFLEPAQLERRWRAVLGDAAPSTLIAMCGSGVTACHHLLALQMAGLGGAKLYAGSFSEWIQDPARPVARAGAP